MIKSYIKKPEVVKAVEVVSDLEIRKEIVDWVNSEKDKFDNQNSALISPDGIHLVRNRDKSYVAPGNMIIQKDNGEFYSCPAKVFEDLYQEYEK